MSKTPNLYPMWINSPSKLQPYNRYHGRNVIASELSEGLRRVGFCDAPITMDIPDKYLEKGFRKPE